jgi:CBS domain-containing membrane protein
MNLIPVDPVNLGLKGKLLSVISCFIAIFATAWISQLFNISTLYPNLIASMGASAVILFIVPNSPLAQPWPMVGGQLVSVMVGVICAQIISDTILASATAVGLSVLAMLLLRCLHPPGAASALAPVLLGDSAKSLGFGYVLMPVALNIVTMLLLALVINRWLLGHDYPVKVRQHLKKKHNHEIDKLDQITGISERDLESALHDRDTFLDITVDDLSKLLTDAHRNRYLRTNKYINCADIMVRDIMSVEYGTDVEDAWKIMQQNKLKSLPVIDKSRRVIGIITWHDFFKFVSVNNNENFQEKFRAFIRRTPDITTDKPESVGHIMASPVTVLKESSHIFELITLMLNNGHRQIPIVNQDNRLIGMVYQDNLIAALYNERQSY